MAASWPKDDMQRRSVVSRERRAIFMRNRRGRLDKVTIKRDVGPDVLI
jgi:hypothetical protein